jgi:hypothetical protein
MSSCTVQEKIRKEELLEADKSDDEDDEQLEPQFELVLNEGLSPDTRSL